MGLNTQEGNCWIAACGQLISISSSRLPWKTDTQPTDPGHHWALMFLTSLMSMKCSLICIFVSLITNESALLLMGNGLLGLLHESCFYPLSVLLRGLLPFCYQFTGRLFYILETLINLWLVQTSKISFPGT